MKSERESGAGREPRKASRSPAPEESLSSGRKFTSLDWFALLFGLFLGLSLIKFGNPVILDSKVIPPSSWDEYWSDPWPPSWSFWLLIPLAVAGVLLVLGKRGQWRNSRWLWLLPLIWFLWQLLSSTQTVDRQLTGTTIRHFAGCVACYLLGGFLPFKKRQLHLLLVGLLAAFAFCLVRAANQKLFEFPREQQFLVEGERTGWTNVAPELVSQMKREGLITNTNGMDIANPLMMAKYAKGRVHGTLVYPNALAGVELLLWPAALVVAVNGTRRFRVLTRWISIVLAAFLGIGVLFWTGSKSGWLIALCLTAVWLFRLNWSSRLKWRLVVALMVLGLTVFGVRFKNYFASGATSVGARFDYWRSALQITRTMPVFGSGPGTFQRPYEQLKSPDAEMARLVHNDYLEQFSDSGIPGGLSFLLWIVLLVGLLGRRIWNSKDPLLFALFLGLSGYLAQSLTEFGLYIPALAWTAFSIAGCLLQRSANEIDKPMGAT